MRVLVSNDDGVDAEGLAALRMAAKSIGRPFIVAPQECHSGGGHRVTTHGPIHLSQRAEACYAIDGTPADCVRVALDRLARKTDWILAGINHGGNLGADLYMSGTAAADFGGRKATATCSGIVDGCVYLGTGIQSLCLGYLTTHSWLWWPLFLMPFALIGGLIALKIWHELPAATRKYIAEVEDKAVIELVPE
jgi:hypothetical protein